VLPTQPSLAAGIPSDRADRLDRFVALLLAMTRETTARRETGARARRSINASVPLLVRLTIFRLSKNLSFIPLGSELCCNRMGATHDVSKMHAIDMHQRKYRGTLILEYDKPPAGASRDGFWDGATRVMPT